MVILAYPQPCADLSRFAGRRAQLAADPDGGGGGRGGLGGGSRGPEIVVVAVLAAGFGGGTLSGPRASDCAESSTLATPNPSAIAICARSRQKRGSIPRDDEKSKDYYDKGSVYV